VVNKWGGRLTARRDSRDVGLKNARFAYLTGPR